MKTTTKLTSVRVDEELFNKFKQECIPYKFSLKQLVNKAIFCYLYDENFKNIIHSSKNTK